MSIARTRHPRMFWHLILLKYNQWRLQHLLVLFVLLVYSMIGAVCFVALEQQNERARRAFLRAEALLRSNTAKREFIQKLRKHFKIPANRTTRFAKNLGNALTIYDKKMGLMADDDKPIKWTIWGGLYYAGTVFTTIGYGDMAAETVGGRIFTMFYAIIGIPLVVIVLTDWGGLLFDFAQLLWLRSLKGFVFWLRSFVHTKKFDNTIVDKLQLVGNTNCGDAEAVPLKVAVVLLVFWILLCASVFCLFEEWTFFESTYFFVVSLTTIGFGDLTPRHTVAVGNFFLILVGLSVVSMSINVIQMKIGNLFQRIVEVIEDDFKLQILAESEEKLFLEMRKQLNGDITVVPPKHVNFLEEYEKNVSTSEKLLLMLMPNYQKQMLNEKKEERSRLRNRATQTIVSYESSFAQTDEIRRILELQPLQPLERHEENTALPHKLYIYNTGE